MNVPSLLVIFVGGWGADIESKSNLLYRQDFVFLQEFLSAYPTVCLTPTKDLNNFYSIAGSLNQDDQTKYSLHTLLDSHGIKQVTIADPDRYGYLTEQFRDENSAKLDNESWQYTSFPPAESLSEVNTGSMPNITAKFQDFLNKKQDYVFYVSIANMWTMGKYKDLGVLKKTVEKTDKYISHLIHKAMEKDMVVMVVSDGGMAEGSINLEEVKVEAKRTENPLPCILIHKELEGVRADNADIASESLMPVRPTSTVADLAPTIISIMGITLPSNLKGNSLFEKQIEKLK